MDAQNKFRRDVLVSVRPIYASYAAPSRQGPPEPSKVGSNSKKLMTETYSSKSMVFSESSKRYRQAKTNLLLLNKQCWAALRF
jgi:hypothetical protein